MSKPGNEIYPLLRKIRQERALGKINKRFEDEFYALDLLKILYDDTIENSIKVELLINLEEYGLLGITEESIDQIVTSLLDIQHQLVDKGENWPVVCQILETCTSLIVQLEQQASDLCKTVVKELVSIVTSKVNQPDSHRLRSCACQCLIHLEEFQQGLLLSYCDDFCELARQERTEVFQDYALLAAKVLSSTGSFLGEKNATSSEQDIQSNVQKQMSYEPQDIRQIVAYLVENIPVYTRSGTFRIIECLSSLVKCKPEVSPMIFKPPMLHQMSTMSCVIFHTVLHLQRKFEGKILSEQEENGLITRLCYMTDHPSLNLLHRLLASQWAQMYNVHGGKMVTIHPSIRQKHRLIFYPTVFDSIDCQLRKLYMTAVCADTRQDLDGVETSILLGSLGCLHKMVWHTGSGLAARALFKALYFIYTYHNNNSFSQDIQRFVRGLISEFAHFIPHSIDFADSIRTLDVDRQVYVDTLILLHQQVVMATEEQICRSFHFYLEIMKKAGAHKEIDPKPTLKFLTYLAENAETIDDSSWKLGHGILDICRNIIICHGTQFCFLENEIIKQSIDVKKGFATLSFIIAAAFVLPALTLLGRAIHKINNQKIKMFSHHLVYFTWLLVSCLLICILNVLNLFDNFINSDNQSKSGKTCYYIYVLYSTLVSFVGICLVSLAIDVTWLTASTTQHLVEIARKKMRIHVTCFILLVVCFFINNVPHLSQHVSFRSLNKCWKGNAYEGHANIAAVIDLVQHGVIIFTTSVTLLLTMFIIRYKTRQSELMVIPEYMRVMDNDADTNIGDIEQTEEGLQASVSVETPSSELIAKSDEQAMGYKRFEPQANENGKQRLLYRQNGSLKRSSRWKAEKDSSSKDSSCHENSGYISEEQDGHEQRRLNLGFNSTRRRIKSDSEIQEPRSQTYVAVRKSRKQKSHKMMEDQVFEALENFFMTDPTKLLFKALASQKQCELSAHLIDESNEDKGAEEETSFNGKKLKKLEIRKKNIKLPLRKSKSLKGPSSHTDRKSRTNWSSLSYKGRSSINGGESIECLDYSQCPETFTLREKGIESTKGTEIDVSKTEAVQKDSIEVEKKVEVFNSPKIIVEDVDKEPTALVSEPNKIARENSDPHLSVNVDVHCSDFNVSISSMDTIVTDIECHIKEHSRTKSVDMPKTQQARDIAGGIEENARSKSIDVPKTQLNSINWVEFMPDDNVKMAKLKDDRVRENNSLFVNVETQTDKNDAVGTDKLETDAVFSDIGKNDQAVLSDIKKNDQAGVDMNVNSKSNRDGMETEIGTKSEIAVEVANTSEIETENSVEKRKEEMVQFKDYCKRYLLQPYKNITGFLVVYAVCLLPQILLDIYRIVAGNQETVLDRTDGIIAICSDAAQPVFLLAITVLFLWQCRERRNIKEEGISQQ